MLAWRPVAVTVHAPAIVQSQEELSHSLVQKLQDMGFERGWGNTVGRIKESFHLLLDIMQVRGPRPPPTTQRRHCFQSIALGKDCCWAHCTLHPRTTGLEPFPCETRAVLCGEGWTLGC